MIHVLLLFGLFLVIVVGLGTVPLFVRLRHAQVQPSHARFTDAALIPPAEQAVLDQPRRWLEVEGFTWVGWLAEPDLIIVRGGVTGDRPRSLFVDATGTIRCSIGLGHDRRGPGYAITFSSQLPNGEEIATANRSGSLPVPASYHHVDHFLASDHNHLALHQQRIASRAPVSCTDPSELLAQINRVRDDLFQHWLSIGMLENAGGEYRLSWRGVLAIVRAARAYSARMRRIQ